MATVTITNAEKALKDFYLDVIAHQINTQSNPLYAMIKRNESCVYGKEVRKAAIYGVNGGVSAGTEDGNLPGATGNRYAQFVSTLKNLYGTVEISDKAIRAGENASGAFVNLLNEEMDGLLRGAKFNFARMLYGDGSGKLCTLSGAASDTAVVNVDTARNLAVGMVVDIFTGAAATVATVSGLTVKGIEKAESGYNITLSQKVTAAKDSIMTVQGSKDREITGLEAIFSTSGSLYGIARSGNGWLNAYTAASTGSISDAKIQAAIDAAEETSGSNIDIALCSYGVRRAYASALESNKRSVNVTELEGGYKALTYAGIPIVADRFVPSGTMYLLASEDFELHQLCDWRWLEGENGSILRQIPGKPVFGATLVKYAELMCCRPCGQARLTGITEA